MLNAGANGGARAHLHAIGTAVPNLDVHQDFIAWATTRLRDRHAQALFRRMSARSGITHRWSVLPHHEAGKVYWSMDDSPEATDLVNRCDEDQTYEARLAAGTLPGTSTTPSTRATPGPSSSSAT